MQVRKVLPLVMLTLLLLGLNPAGCSRNGQTELTLNATPPSPDAEDGSGTTPRQQNLLISFIGDIMAHDMNFERPPYENIYAAVKDSFLKDDLTFGNLEFPVVPELPMSSYPLFNNHLPYVLAAFSAGIDVFACANNHATDQGGNGVIRTFEVLQELQYQKGLYFSGISKEAGSPWAFSEIRRNGFKIGFIAITEFLNSYAGKDYVYLVDYTNTEQKDRFLSFIESARNSYDLIIVSVHGGTEYSRYPETYKKDFFRRLTAAGANIVWGHHPHVLQPWELVKEDGVNRLIMYSTGNFISGQIWFLDPANPDPVRRYTGDSIIMQAMAGRLSDGRVSILSVTPVFTSNYKDPEKGMVVVPIETLISAEKIPVTWRTFYAEKYLETRRVMQNHQDLHNFPQ
ncbi:MAG: CapA family protein [Spirochaetales bacterium]|nr:MAG: CapA family protein [Spirochaetales bacterium]